jgi:hypothetical protein
LTIAARDAILPHIMPTLRVEFRPKLAAHRGKLLSRSDRGVEVHAASFVRQDLIVLDEELKTHPRELKRILLHEIFHFVWVRLGNPRRRSWEELLTRELRGRARGELGWSAEWRKRELSRTDRTRRSRKWREYCCESFCDSAAWMGAGTGRHPEITLAAAWRGHRRDWFANTIAPVVLVPQLKYRD